MNMFNEFCKVFKFSNEEINTIIWKSLNADITQDKNAWQDHSTPDVICDQMTDLYKDKFENTQKVLILFNVEFIKSIYFKYENVILKNIYFVADTEKKYNWVKNEFPKINISLLTEHNINKLNECIEGFNVKKFDIVFSNPPYNKNLDLKILESLFEQKISDKIIFVHPAGYLLSSNESPTLITNRIKNSNVYFLKTAHLFWGNILFDIDCHTPLVISQWTINKCDKISVTDTWNNECYFIKDINNISYLGKHFIEIKRLFSNLVEKYTNVENHIQKPIEYIENKVKYKIYKQQGIIGISLPKIAGIIDEKETGKFFLSICQDSDFLVKTDVVFTRKINEKSGKTGGISNAIVLWFNSEKECENFINYMKTKIYRIALSLYKMNPHSDSSCMRSIPWMDFTKEWNDAKLCKEFGISEDLWDYIDNFIPDYYDDYVSGF